MKKCSDKQCNKIKDAGCFYKNSYSKDGLDFICSECRRRDSREYRFKNLEACRQKSRNWRRDNKQKVSFYNKDYLPKYYEENKERLIKESAEYKTKRRREVPSERLKNNLRRRLNNALKGNTRSLRTMELIGCSLRELMVHLESRFVSGMTWDNYGKVWHVDHIKPLAAFDLTKESELKAASNYLNLQPLFAKDNLRKLNKY